MSSDSPEATTVVLDAQPAEEQQSRPEPTSETVVPATDPASEISSRHNEGGDNKDKDAAPAKIGSSQLQEPLDDLDWLALEDRYLAKMNQLKAKEQELIDDYTRVSKIFDCWARATIHHEEERGFKRLRTRIEHVRMSEEGLEEKREHYIKVVKAFKDALDLL